MKRIVVFSILLALLSFGLNAQVSSSASDSIVFEKTVHDYGTISQGSNGDCEFIFTNKGKAPLVLTNVRASCGCTVPDWPRDPIMPGKSGTIKVKYNTHITGNFNKSITVNSNASNSLVMLRVTGNVVASN